MFKKSLLLILLMTLLAPWAVAQNQLNEGFESATFPPEEWSTIHVSGNNSWARSTSQHHNGNASAYAHWASAGHENYMITPKLEPQSGESLSFFVSAQSYSGTTLYVKVSTTTPEASAFSTTLATYTTGSSGTIGTTSTSTFVEKIIDVSSYAGQQIYIAFHIVDSNGGDIYIDDVTGVTLYVPACPKPTGLTATLTPGNGTVATLNWTAGGTETAWVLEYGTASDFTGATSVNVSGTPEKPLTGLTAETTYYARVKATCGGSDQSDWSATCEFTPTNQLFINIFGETGSTNDYLPTNTLYDYSYTQQIYTAVEMGGFACTLQSVAFKGNKAAVCDLDIYLAKTDKSSFTATTNYIDISEATLVFSGEVTFTANDWTTIAFNNDFDYTGGNLAIIVDDNSGNYTYGSTTWQTFNTTAAQALYFYQDNTNINPSSPSGSYSGTPTLKNQIKFSYELPSPYVKPKNLEVTNLTATTATITWEAPNSDVQSYKYQYREEGGTWNTLTSTTALSAPLTGLTGNTTYTFQVQAIYSGGESAFASKTFTTPIAIPYEYGFEDANEFNKWETADCEDDITNGISGVVNYTDYAHSGDNFFAFSSYNGATDPQYLFSPLLSGISEGLHVEFYYRSIQADDPETFMIGYSTTDKDPDHFTWGNEITSPDANYNLFKANYPANTKYIAVKYTSGDSFYLLLDDFTFEEASSCLEPTNVTASGITTEEATIDWTIGKEETEWDIYYTDDMTDVPDDSTAPIVEGTSTKPYTLDGLSDATTYYVYVRAVCGSSETSAWSTPCTFHTECYGLDMPMSAYSFEDGELSVCWNTYSDNIAYNRTSISDDEAHTGTYSLEFYRGSQTGDLIVTLPEVKHAYPIDWYQFDFWAMADASDLIITIGIMEDPNDPTTFVAQGAGIEPESSFSEYKVRFNEYTGDGHYVAIMVTREGSKGSVYVDDVAIQVIPSCIEPDGLTVTAPTAHGATFGWTPNGTETEWHLYLSDDATAPADDINLKEVTVADSNPFTLTTGLDAETTYYVWVRANCGSTDGYSMWVGPETFTTDVACPAPTGLAASEITGHTAKLSWTGTSESYVLSVGTYDYTATPVTGTILETGFESTSMPDGWTHIGNGTGVPATSNTHNGSYSLKFSGATSDNVVVLPQFGAETNQLTIDFWSKAESSNVSSSGYFDLGYVTNPTDASTFVALDTYSASDHGSYTHIEKFSMTSAPNGARIAFRHRSGVTYYYWFIDDVTITGPIYPIAWDTYNTTDTQKTVEGLDPETQYFAKVKGNCGTEGFSQETEVVSFTTDVACPAPTGFAIEAVGSNYALLNWNLGTDDAWQVEVYNVTDATPAVTYDISMSEVTVNAGVVTYTLNGLTPEKEYTLKLRADCTGASDGYSEWAVLPNFTTIAACSAMDVTFENITHHNVTVNWNGESDDDFTVYYREAASASTTTLFSEDFEDEATFANWTFTSKNTANNIASGKAGRLAEAKHDGNYGFRFSSFTSCSSPETYDQYLVSPELTVTGILQFYYKKYNNNTENLQVGYSTTTDDFETAGVFTWTDLDLTTTWQQYELNLPDNVKYIAFHYWASCQYYVFVDDIAIKERIPAGDYQTQLVEGNTTNITSLTADTKYEVRVVPNCNPSLGTAWTSFNTVAGNEKYFLTAGDWATTTNWMDGEIPTITDNAIILANVAVEDGEDASANNVTLQNSSVITTKNGATLTIKGTVTGGGSDKIIIEDGGQLIHNNSVYATVKKNITAPAVWKGSSDSDGWYLIATPVYSTTISSAFTGVIDLFEYNEPEAYWYSYNNGDHTFTSMTRGAGYLHASQNTQTVSYAGSMIGTESAETKSLSYTSTLGDDVRGFNLVGNPYTRNLVLGDMTIGSTPVSTVYVITDEDRTKLTAYTTDEYAVKPGEGFFVQATAASQTLTMNPAAKDAFDFRYIKIVAGNENGSDNAYIQFENGNTLRKMNIANKTSVYVIDNGEDYAAATVYELEGKIPVNFKAIADGEYTITINANNVEAHSMYLRDNFSGETIDLLESPSYTFKATANDDEARFTLLFDFNNFTGIDENYTGEIFAYQYGNEIIVNGEGTLEVFDVMGRMVLNTKVNGVQKVNVPANAVYIFKLMGETVKTQKIVVR
ncbi:MAG: choice-of-anchor J domain-containing protein [Bacteroidales bacterium]|nr:choice-of-anchor J domain-containing protein [Bacteroidales bacterium]